MSYTKDADAVFQTGSGSSVITCLLFVILKYSEVHREAAKATRQCKNEGFLKACPFFPIFLKWMGREEWWGEKKPGAMPFLFYRMDQLLNLASKQFLWKY